MRDLPFGRSPDTPPMAASTESCSTDPSSSTPSPPTSTTRSGWEFSAQDDPDVRCVVLEGSGGVFASGGNLKSLQDVLANEVSGLAGYVEAFDDPLPYQAILDCSKPVIAKIDGLCLAGGCCSSLRLTRNRTERSRFGLPEARAAWPTAPQRHCCRESWGTHARGTDADRDDDLRLDAVDWGHPQGRSGRATRFRGRDRGGAFASASPDSMLSTNGG